MEDVENIDTGVVHYHIRNAPASGMKDLGYSVGYKYPHDFPGHIVKQQYMPDNMVGKVYYEPTDIGYEHKISEYLKWVKDNTSQEEN